MHCPSCGAETTLEQRFCRSCGMDLETVSKLVAAHSSPEKLKLEKSLTENAIRQRRYQSLRWGMLLFILGTAALSVVKTLALNQTFKLIALSLLFLAMGVMFFGVFTPTRDNASKPGKVSGPGRTGELPEAEATKELPSARIPVPVPSITERTTQLLATEEAGKPRE
jgi:cytochrome c biogenesis protein CcdA